MDWTLMHSLPVYMSFQFYSPKDAVSAATDEERLIKIHDVIQQLPPPHYRFEYISPTLAKLEKYDFSS